MNRRGVSASHLHAASVIHGRPNVIAISRRLNRVRGALNWPPTIVPGERFSAENSVEAGQGDEARVGGTLAYCTHHIHFDAGGAPSLPLSATIDRRNHEEDVHDQHRDCERCSR